MAELWNPTGMLCRDLSAARGTGKLRVFCLGLGVDRLTFAVDILTVAVCDSDTFDVNFGALSPLTLKGAWSATIARVRPGVPFTGEVIRRFEGGTEPMQAAGAAVLQLAWRYRTSLLA
jgi:hypothetical protein